MASEPSSIREVGKRTSYVSKPRIVVMNGSPWVRSRFSGSRSLGWRSFGCCLAADQPGHDQGHEDDRAVDGLDPVVGCVGQVEDVLNQAEQEDPGRGADHVA